MSTPQSITLTISGGRRHIGIARLFVGGLAARAGFGFEAMDDLQLAVESALTAGGAAAELTVEATIDADSMTLVLGPFDGDPLAPSDSESERLGLQRLLAALVERTESYERDGGHWLSIDARTGAATLAGRP